MFKRVFLVVCPKMARSFLVEDLVPWDNTRVPDVSSEMRALSLQRTLAASTIIMRTKVK